MYSIGGWNTKPGSCNSGLRSRPSAGLGNKRSNGLEVSNTKAIKPMATKPSTPSTRATTTSGRERENVATATPQPDSISNQSNNEPS